MNLDTLKRLVKQHVTASASTQHHMIQPVQLMLRGGKAQTVEEAFRRMDAWLELLGDYEPTTRRSYLTGMRDILRVRPIADALVGLVDPGAQEERLGALIKETSNLISSKVTNNDADAEKAALRLRVKLLEQALDVIASVSRLCSSTGSA